MESGTSPKMMIKEQIKKLVALQAVDKERFDIQQEMHDKPLEVEKLKQEFEAKKIRFHELETRVRDQKVARDQLELELKSLEDAIQKADGQLLQLKTNKEYQAKLIEIETMKADKARVEEKILTSYDQTDGVNAELDKEKEFIAEEEKKFNEAKEKVDALLVDLKQNLDKIKIQTQQLQEGIDTQTLNFYTRVLEKCGGIGIVPVIGGNSCGGCHMNVPVQMINQIKMYKEIIKCETCQRILYIEDDL